MGKYVVVSADAHSGVPNDGYRPYLEPSIDRHVEA